MPHPTYGLLPLRFRLLAGIGRATLRSCLEDYFECTGGHMRPQDRSEGYAWRYPDLRGPTSTRP
jgi:hypothetical protein